MFSALLSSLLALVVVFVPIDDRPATSQFPALIARIAGVRLLTPVRAALGHYLAPGDPDAILRWLGAAPAQTQAFIVSNDMVAYGGLVASRISAVDLAASRARLAALAAVRVRHSLAAFTVFGTVMRLAPTGIPALGPAADFPFAGKVWPQIQRYANLPDPPQSSQQAEAARLRAQLGPVLESYLATRRRNLALDLDLLRYDASGAFDRVVLGQDDAGPIGLNIPELDHLFAYARSAMPYGRWSIEPGTDELAMIYVAAALTRQAGLVPRVRVVYSRADGGAVQDPLEFAPIAVTIADIVRSSGGVETTAGAPADVDLYVHVPGTDAADEERFVDAIATDPYHAAVADLSFLESGNPAAQRQLMDELAARGVAGNVDAFASWNTTANTIGTVVPEAFAVLAGQRMNTYDATAHRSFTFMRYVDDVLFQKVVRPQVNETLTRDGVRDHTYLLPPDAARAAAQTDALLRPLASDLLAKIDSGYRMTSFSITLPWDRTFETELELTLTP